jgi:hypothetical protein
MSVQADALAFQVWQAVRGLEGVLDGDLVGCQRGIVRHEVRRVGGGVIGCRRAVHRERQILSPQARSRPRVLTNEDWV